MKRKHDDTRSTVLSADHNASVYDQCMDNTIYPSPDPIYDETYVPRNGGQYSGAVVRWVYISMYLLRCFHLCQFAGRDIYRHDHRTDTGTQSYSCSDDGSC